MKGKNHKRYGYARVSKVAQELLMANRSTEELDYEVIYLGGMLCLILIQ